MPKLAMDLCSMPNRSGLLSFDAFATTRHSDEAGDGLDEELDNPATIADLDVRSDDRPRTDFDSFSRSGGARIDDRLRIDQLVSSFSTHMIDD